MARSEPFSLEGIDRIPDPAASVAPGAVPGGSVGAGHACTPPAEASPTRAERQRLARVLGIASVAWVVAVVVGFGVRPDLGRPAVLGLLAALGLTLALGAGLVLRPRARGLPAGVRVVQHAVWVIPAIFVAGALATGVSGEAGPTAWASARGCLALSNLMALGPLVAAALLLRRSFLAAAGWRGAAVGALAGLAGTLGVHAHCPCAEIGHLLAAHGPPIAVGAALGGLFGLARGRV